MFLLYVWMREASKVKRELPHKFRRLNVSCWYSVQGTATTVIVSERSVWSSWGFIERLELE
jgi:hypothetical protein